MISKGKCGEEAFGNDIYCPQCTYKLYGAPGPKCPECGYDISKMREAATGIPWPRRRERGVFLTGWQTAWLVTARHRQFCEAYAGKLDYREARLFAFFCVVHVFVIVVLATILEYSSGVEFSITNPATGCNTLPDGLLRRGTALFAMIGIG